MLFDPFLIIDYLARQIAADEGVEQVRIHGRRVIAPNTHVGDVAHGYGQLRGELGDRAVVIEAHHRRGPARAGCRARCSSRSGSSCWRGCRRRGSSRRWPPTPFSALPCTVNISPLALSSSARSMPLVRGREPTSSATLVASKASSGAVVEVEARKQREGTVDQLHRHSLQRAHRLRHLQQAQVDGLLGRRAARRWRCGTRCCSRSVRLRR